MEHLTALISKFVFLFSFLVLFCFGSNFACAQGKGYKGHQFQIEAKSSLQLLPEVSLKYITSRKAGIALEYGMRKVNFEGFKFELDPESIYGNGDLLAINLPVKTNYYEMMYTFYPSIAPVKRYMSLGFGVEFLEFDVDEIKFSVENEKDLLDKKAAVTYLRAGMGTNLFLTDHLYLNSELSMNFAFMKSVRDFLYFREAYSNDQPDDYVYSQNIDDNVLDFYFSRMFNLRLGLGVSF